MERVGLVKLVHNAPSYEEYFGLNDNILGDDDFSFSEGDEDVKKMILVMLALLEEFCIHHMYDEAYYYNSEQFKEDIAQLNKDLKNNLLVLFTEYSNILVSNLDGKWRIPKGTVEIPIELEEIINSGIDTVTNSLYYELKDKAVYYTILSLNTGSFSPHGSFRRTIKKLINQISFKGHDIRKIINRKYDEFIYGQDALFRWRCSGINTCEWCYSIEAAGAMPLSWFPIDHINGGCVLLPENPDKYSEEYARILEEYDL